MFICFFFQPRFLHNHIQNDSYIVNIFSVDDKVNIVIKMTNDMISLSMFYMLLLAKIIEVV